jgi:hypothetical protein
MEKEELEVFGIGENFEDRVYFIPYTFIPLR